MNKKSISLCERERLTESQQRVFEGILKYQKANGYAPSIRELCAIASLASTSSVYSILRALEQKGYIARRPESPRAIAVL